MKNRILVVDDDHAMARTLSDILQLKGWVVQVAHSGIDALNLVIRQDFDAVVMDFKMPGMSGVDAFRAIRERRPSLRVVLMTAWIGQDDLAQAQREGVTRVLPKPLDINQLLKVLDDNGTRRRPVLLVDSDPTFLRTLQEVLTIRGFEAVACATVVQAVEAMSHRAPAAVMLHLNPATGSARGLAESLSKVSPAATLVVYSGRPDGDAEIRAALPAEWPCTYLHKPFAVEQVTALLEKAGREAAA